MKNLFFLAWLFLANVSNAQSLLQDTRLIAVAPVVTSVGVNNAGFVNNGSLLPARTMQHSLLYFYQSESDPIWYNYRFQSNSLYYALNVGITRNHQISIFIPYHGFSAFKYYTPLGTQEQQRVFVNQPGNCYLNYHINVFGNKRWLQFAPRFSLILPAKDIIYLSKNSFGLAGLLPFSKNITNNLIVRANLGFTHYFNQMAKANFIFERYVNYPNFNFNLNDIRISTGMAFNSKKRFIISTDFEYRFCGVSLSKLDQLQFNFQPCISYTITKAKYVISPMLQSNINLLYKSFGANVGLVLQHKY